MTAIAEFVAEIRKVNEIVFFTGAGISTESGVPDFRSPGGIWTKYTPVYFSDFVNSEAARVRYWRMKKESYELYKNVQPNIAHYSIRRFEDKGRLWGLITQNVDGLHGLAGVPQEKIVELHGTDRKVCCLSCGECLDASDVYELIVGDFKPPACAQCGGLLKSATISFGQAMPVEAMQRARTLSRTSKIFIVIGSSLQVQPAASFPVLAKQNGALLAIVNREVTPQDTLADFRFTGAIGDFFRELNPLLADD
ncbi:MAG: NAD-dependent deacetylase [Candidatus Binatia bacterium]